MNSIYYSQTEAVVCAYEFLSEQKLYSDEKYNVENVPVVMMSCFFF